MSIEDAIEESMVKQKKKEQEELPWKMCFCVISVIIVIIVSVWAGVYYADDQSKSDLVWLLTFAGLSGFLGDITVGEWFIIAYAIHPQTAMTALFFVFDLFGG